MSRRDDDLLTQLMRGSDADSGDSAWNELVATVPSHASAPAGRNASDGAGEPEDPKLAALLAEIHGATSGDAGKAGPVGSMAESDSSDEAGGAVNGFFPTAPRSIDEAGLTDAEVEALVLKSLFSRGSITGRDIAEQLTLPFVVLEPLFRELKHQQQIVYRGSAAMNDYCYELTDLGRERARRLSQHCTYFGAAPVPVADYIKSVQAQSLERQQPTIDDLRRAFDDLLIPPSMLRRLGPAIHSGRGLFLYGAPGNGKTSIAERVTRAFGQHIWIPRALGVDGEIIRLFDPINHEEAPWERKAGLLDHSEVDRRWVRIRRPTIIVGGELTMDSLEVALNLSTGISEAPLQLKANCGTLVIDDFGRQRMSIDELLNRWIVPLEKRYDFLNLPNGRKLKVPFDQLIVFSTNLEPRDLVDDAFLRRIPYKIEVTDPTEQDFAELFQIMCDQLGFEFDEPTFQYLVQRHYREAGRPFRCCHPRDLLLQVRHLCAFEGVPPQLTCERIDQAVENYFSVM